jgi:ABC-type sugar transport system ATPase subunit
MNFLECNLIKHTTTIHLESEGISFKLPNTEINSSPSKHLPKKITIGIRPKDINILEDEDEDLADIKMKGEITFTEMLGDDSIIEVKIGSSLIKVANTNPTLDLSIGRVIMLGTTYSKIHFFDTDNGKRILL